MAESQLFPVAEAPLHRYLCIYEMDTADIDRAREQLIAVGEHSLLSDAMDWRSLSALVYEAISEPSADSSS